jgi:hypothetical protein
MSFVQVQPIALRPPDAAKYIGISEDVLENCKNAGWIKPGLQLKRMVIYDTGDLILLWRRIKRDGLPPRTKRTGTPPQDPVSSEAV